MNTKTKIPPPVIVSKDLSAYRLTKKHQGVLKRWDDMQAYLKLANKSSEVIRLNLADFADIDAAVRNQSDGKRDLSQCRYKGVPVLSIASPPQLEAFA